MASVAIAVKCADVEKTIHRSDVTAAKLSQLFKVLASVAAAMKKQAPSIKTLDQSTITLELPEHSGITIFQEHDGSFILENGTTRAVVIGDAERIQQQPAPLPILGAGVVARGNGPPVPPPYGFNPFGGVKPAAKPPPSAKPVEKDIVLRVIPAKLTGEDLKTVVRLPELLHVVFKDEEECSVTTINQKLTIERQGVEQIISTKDGIPFPDDIVTKSNKYWRPQATNNARQLLCIPKSQITMRSDIKRYLDSSDDESPNGSSSRKRGRKSIGERIDEKKQDLMKDTVVRTAGEFFSCAICRAFAEGRDYVVCNKCSALVGHKECLIEEIQPEFVGDPVEELYNVDRCPLCNNAAYKLFLLRGTGMIAKALRQATSKLPGSG